MRYFLGIDNGGTATKAALFDQTGAEIATASRETPLKIPRAGWNERDMEELWEVTLSCVREVMECSGVPAEQVAGVGCTGHGKGLYLWGKDAPVYMGIASTDQRATELVAQWKKDGIFAKVQEKTLQPILACQPVALLRWIKEEEPEVYQKIKWIFSCKDYIRFRLTGIAMLERTDCSGTSLMDLTSGKIEPSLLQLFGLSEIESKLPPLCNAWDCCGFITQEVAEKTGLPVGIPVSGGMFDIDACAIAAGVIQEDQVCMITGTWSINEYISPAPIRLDETTRNSFFCLPETYLIEESSPTSAGNLEWYLQTCMKKEVFMAEQEGKSIYDLVEKLVENLPPEKSKTIFLPFLYGTNTQVGQAAFVGITNDSREAHLLRAIFEGVAFSHRMHMERLLRFRAFPKAIRLVGGASRSRVWVQIFADVMGCPIEVIETKELGTQGAAMTAAVASGHYRDPKDAINHMVREPKTVFPDRKMCKIYKEKYARYMRLISYLEGF